MIVALMALAFAVVAVSEWLAARARFVPPAVAFLPPLDDAGEPAPYVEAPAPPWGPAALEPAEDTEPDALTIDRAGAGRGRGCRRGQRRRRCRSQMTRPQSTPEDASVDDEPGRSRARRARQFFERRRRQTQRRRTRDAVASRSVKIYFAGPLFTPYERALHRRVRSALRADGFEVFVPHEHELALGAT